VIGTEIECLIPAGDRCGEGVYHDPSGRLWWTDVCRFLLHRYDLATSVHRSWDLGEPVVGVVPIAGSADLLIALGSRIVRWEPETAQAVAVVHREPGSPRVRLNEVRADPEGYLWIGSMGNNVGSSGESIEFAQAAGQMVRRSPDGTIAHVRDAVGITNTLVWDEARRTAYTADTLRDEIYRYRLDAEGAPISWDVLIADVGRGSPDGSAIDVEGFVWNCRFGGRAVLRIAPDGTIDRVVELPTANPTTCTFGGAEGSTLYVTSASIHTDERDRLAGSLWAVDAGVLGVAAHAAEV
jgi:sugar lactone lactonase YvrE